MFVSITYFSWAIYLRKKRIRIRITLADHIDIILIEMRLTFSVSFWLFGEFRKTLQIQIMVFIFYLNTPFCRGAFNRQADLTEAIVHEWKDTFPTFGIDGIFYLMLYWLRHCSSVIFTLMRRLLSPDACLLFLYLWCIWGSWKFSSCSEK